MRSNSLKTNQQGTDSPATQQGPKPGDFTLGSAESRAAARAMVGKPASPRPGDVVIEINEPWLPIPRASEIYRIPGGTAAETSEQPKFNPSCKIFFKFPEAFDRSISTKAKDRSAPRDKDFWSSTTEEFLEAVLRAASPQCEPTGYWDVQIFRDVQVVPVSN
jgi:hypothetical protein